MGDYGGIGASSIGEDRGLLCQCISDGIGCGVGQELIFPEDGAERLRVAAITESQIPTIRDWEK